LFDALLEVRDLLAELVDVGRRGGGHRVACGLDARKVRGSRLPHFGHAFSVASSIGLAALDLGVAVASLLKPRDQRCDVDRLGRSAVGDSDHVRRGTRLLCKPVHFRPALTITFVKVVDLLEVDIGNKLAKSVELLLRIQAAELEGVEGERSEEAVDERLTGAEPLTIRATHGELRRVIVALAALEGSRNDVFAEVEHDLPARLALADGLRLNRLRAAQAPPDRIEHGRLALTVSPRDLHHVAIWLDLHRDELLHVLRGEADDLHVSFSFASP
jgi:hypothetical protein